MQHYQHWKSLEQKVSAWLELCDFAYQLKLAGIKLNLEDNELAQKELWNCLMNSRHKQRLVTQEAMLKAAE
ncbi:MAG: hypothetical protein QME42_06715 [bacterium]|nr:hypothetical protein [bacterium]